MSLQTGQDSQDCIGNRMAEQAVTGDGSVAEIRLGIPKADTGSGLENASGLETMLPATRKCKANRSKRYKNQKVHNPVAMEADSRSEVPGTDEENCNRVRMPYNARYAWMNSHPTKTN